MQTDTEGPQRVFVELPDISEIAAPIEATFSNADIARSEENILQWMQYLPADCIQSMIRMGWDVTT
jgi:hypothetical protein